MRAATEATTTATATTTTTPSCFDDVATYPALPPGFDALTASPAALQTYGLPPKPPGTNAGPIATWQTAVRDASYESNVDPQCGGPPHAIVDTPNWAGHVIPYAYVGSSGFTWSESDWVQPSVPTNSNYTNWQTAPDASFWDGIGVCSLLQAGADSISTASSATYKMWMEDYSDCNGTVDNDEWWEGPAVSPGNTVYVYVEYQGSDKTYFFLENETTGAYRLLADFRG
ncbi:MAG: G1 family glutamic endopeptidase [Solirubrobacteraceae bacterium]